MASDAPAWASDPQPSKLVRLAVSKDGVHVDGLPLVRSCTSFGRNSAMCDVALDHQSLSRRHALVAYNVHGVPCLLDLNSTHGTFLNGERVPGGQPLTLEMGDVLTFGASTRTYTVEAGASETSGGTSLGGAGVPAEEGEEEEEDGYGPPAPPAHGGGSMPPPALPLPASAPATSGRAPPPSRPPPMAIGSIAALAPSAGVSEKDRGRTELQAAIESMRQPPPRPPPAQRAGDAGSGDVDMAGLPFSFGSRKDGLAGKRVRGRVERGEEEEEEEEGEGEGAGTVRDDGRGDGGVARHETNGQAEDDEEDSDDDYGPAPPPSLSAKTARALTPAERAAAMGLPVSHEAVLGGHTKTVTCAGVDPGGGRMVTGGADFSVRLYDFGGMDRSHRSFRDTVPHEGQVVRAVSWSSSGDRFAVATGAANVKVFNREGQQLVVTIKGDMYLADAVHTKGHQAPATWVGWHPSPDKSHVLLTASSDGTVRLWDLTGGKKIFDELCCSDVIKFKTARGQKAGVTTAAVSPSGKYVLAGLDDGSVHMVALKGPGFRYTRSDASIQNAHGGGVTSLVFSPDGTRFASRGVDDVVRVWDARVVTDKSTPTASLTGLCTTADSANTAWSPDGKLLLCGMGVQAGGRAPDEGEEDGASGGRERGGAEAAADHGRVLVLDVAAVEASCSPPPGPLRAGTGVPALAAAAFTIALGPRVSAVHVTWHPKINQVAVTCSDGVTRLLYSPGLSTKGALLSTVRAPKSRDAESDYVSVGTGNIYLPNALPMYRDEAGPLAAPKRRRVEDGLRTAVPPAGGGSGPAKPVDLSAPLPGVVPEYISGSNKSFTDFFMAGAVRDGPAAEHNLRAEDPQAVLTSYASRAPTAGTAGSLYTRVYATTQPKPIFAEKTLEEERDEAASARSARLKAAGQAVQGSSGGGGGR